MRIANLTSGNMLQRTNRGEQGTKKVAQGKLGTQSPSMPTGYMSLYDNAGLAGVRFGVSLKGVLSKFTNAEFDIAGTMALEREVPMLDYLNEVVDKPALQRNTKQRIYDMITARGTDDKKVLGREVKTYKFFTEPDNPDDALLGMEEQLHTVVEHLQQAALGTDAGKKLLILVGGPGSGKSTVARIIVRGLENYSRTADGERYTLKWKLPKDVARAIGFDKQEFVEEVYTDPVKLLPLEMRKDLEKTLNRNSKLPYPIKLSKEGLPPASQKLYDKLLAYEIQNGGQDGAFERVLQKYAMAKRFKVSSVHRTGSGSLAAVDGKSLDVTHMSGGSKMIKAATSSEGDPWAYDFASGELFAASGGVMEFIEILKLDKEHLLPILTLNEEGKVKPSKQPQVEVDEFVIAHTNLPEYEAKAADPEMAATWDRMKIVRFPYNTAISSEQAIYERSLPLLHQQGINVAPHTMRTASLWVILSRLLPAKDRKFDPLTKARLYNGEPNKDIGMAEIRALKKEGVKGREGMEGISPRKLKDNVIPAIMTHPDVQKTKSIDGYGVLTIIRDKLDSGEIELEGEVKDKAYQNLEIALKDLDEHVKEDVTEAIAGDRDNLNAILDEYLRNVEAFVDKKDVSDWRGISSGPSEQLMQSIEKKMGVSDNRTHRQKLNAILGSYRRDGKPIDLDLFPDIKKAIVQHELEQLERNIPWKALCTTEPLSTKKQEDYRQGVIGNLKKKGYDEESARHALARVGSLFNTNK